MEIDLKFHPERFERKTCMIQQQQITYRAYMDIPYCKYPKDPIQTMNIFVPKQNRLYDDHTAPILFVNQVGGYLPGPAAIPQLDHRGYGNIVFHALHHGYVVVSPGVRGRTSGKISDEFFEGSSTQKLTTINGRMVGRAPACIVDLKAAIRYLRYNKAMIPGDVEHIITTGISAGGALSALLGTSGNQQDYIPYLEEIGAADERDDVFASNCYCPIHNLEHADSAYEWMFSDLHDFHRTKHVKTDHGIVRVPFTGCMSEKQIMISKQLKDRFPYYINQLNLKDLDGNILSLKEDGTGSFLTYLKSYLIRSAQKELHHHACINQYPWLAVKDSEIEKQHYIKSQQGIILDIDWDAYIKKISRMKAAPAFDALDLSSPENEEFGDEKIDKKHFTMFSYTNSESNGILADEKIIKMMNPLSYINASGCTQHWRIRHGAFDRDTSIAIPVILGTLLRNNGYEVDLQLPWGLPHCGDYDLDEFFQWIDDIIK